MSAAPAKFTFDLDLGRRQERNSLVTETAMAALLEQWMAEERTAPEGRWAVELAETGELVGGVAVLPLPPEGEDLDLPNCRFYRVRRLPRIRNVRPGFSLKKVAYDFLLLTESLRMIRRHRYDAIHAVEEAAFIAAILRNWPRRRRSVAMIGAVAAYTVLAGASPSVVRAALMAGVVLVAREGGRPGHAAAALGMVRP